jgi:hypothetical protein
VIPGLPEEQGPIEIVTNGIEEALVALAGLSVPAVVVVNPPVSDTDGDAQIKIASWNATMEQVVEIDATGELRLVRQLVDPLVWQTYVRANQGVPLAPMMFLQPDPDEPMVQM